MLLAAVIALINTPASTHPAVVPNQTRAHLPDIGGTYFMSGATDGPAALSRAASESAVLAICHRGRGDGGLCGGEGCWARAYVPER